MKVRVQAVNTYDSDDAVRQTLELIGFRYDREENRYYVHPGFILILEINDNTKRYKLWRIQPHTKAPDQEIDRGVFTLEDDCSLYLQFSIRGKIARNWSVVCKQDEYWMEFCSQTP